MALELLFAQPLVVPERERMEEEEGLQPDRQEGTQGPAVLGIAWGAYKPVASCGYPTVPGQKGGCCWPWGGQGRL